MWFAVNLLFESVHDKPIAQNLWEEKIIVLQADSEETAQQEGETLGKAEQHDYVSASGDRVRWLYRGVERVFPIDSESLNHGTEVFSRFLKGSEIQSILEKIKDDGTKSKSA